MRIMQSLISSIGFLLPFGLCVSLTHGAIEYSLIDLRVLSGEVGGEIYPSIGEEINDLGQVVGAGFLTPECQSSVECNWYPFLYDPASGDFVNLGDLDGNFGEAALVGNAYAVNNSGWVTGRNQTSQEPAGYRAFYWGDVNGNGVSDPGEMNNLGTDPEFQFSTAVGLNNVGQVIGSDVRYDPRVEIGWLWNDLNGNGASDPGEKTLLPGLLPSALNDTGQVVGAFAEGGGRWTDADGDGVIGEGEVAIVPCTMNPSKVSRAEMINASGQVAGRLYNAYGKTQGYLWTDANEDNVADADEIVVFGADLQHTYSRDLNDSGDIVGGTYYWRSQEGKGYERRAFVWDSEKGIRDLNDLIPEYSIPEYGAFQLTQAEGINNLGQIVATGWFDTNADGLQNSSEPEHVILLTPRLAGDLDVDGVVNSRDLDIVRANWGAEVAPGSLEDGDASGDGQVNSKDLDLVRGTWGQGRAPLAVPEPLLPGWIVAGVLLLGRIRRIRRA